MRKSDTTNRLRLLPLALAAALVLACDESPTGPGDGVSQALVDAVNGDALGASVHGLPQGSDGFSGPGGLPMEATAEEFIQQVTFSDGKTLRTSGVGIYAVPDRNVTAPPVVRLQFGAAATGSLESVEPGTFAIEPMPPFDFIERVDFAHASVFETLPGGTRMQAEEGELVIESLEYFADTYTCELTGSAFEVELCEYQVGLVTGAVEFTVTLEDGTEVLQDRTEFTLPIRRRTIIAEHVGQ